MDWSAAGGECSATPPPAADTSFNSIKPPTVTTCEPSAHQPPCYWLAALTYVSKRLQVASLVCLADSPFLFEGYAAAVGHRSTCFPIGTNLHECLTCGEKAVPFTEDLLPFTAFH